jgi:Flp pilus assembly protein TadD/nitrate/TMAO reductase-like tetraheme cytochrome c subunit
VLSIRKALVGLVVVSACGERAPVDEAREATYVGRQGCESCHAAEAELFDGSHHDLAMQEASEETVLGDFSGVEFAYDGVTSTFYEREGKFFVRTDGADGGLTEHEILYTFGVEPLQQYLVAFPGGRYQALSLAWDTGAKTWFHLYPGEGVDHRDPLHWTKRFQNWNQMCAECHSTALEKNYDLESDSYQTTWKEIDVSCEACHGPGSAHVAWAALAEDSRPEDSGLVVDLSDEDRGVWVTNVETGLSKREPRRSSRREVETCARCHSRRSAQQADYVHGRPLLDTHRLALLTEPLYFADGQIDDEVYVYGSFLQSKMYREGVTCKDCHDPHRLTVRGEGNSICAACHLPEKFDVEAHHHHEPGTAGASCVECHMPARTYMVVDPRRDHSFRAPRPDVSIGLGTPNACNGCHRDRAPEWARQAVVGWFGEDVAPHFGTALDAARRGHPEAGRALEALASDSASPGIARATALSMLAFAQPPDASAVFRSAFADEDPLVRLGALESAEIVPPGPRHQMVFPLLRDEVRSVRIAAARTLASVPGELFTPEQKTLLESVLSEYREAQLRNADWPESHMNLGLLALARGELAEAERSYLTAVKVDPGFSRAYVNLTDLYRQKGEDAKGEAVLREAIENVPEDPELHHALGLVLVRLNRNREAVTELSRAFELRPSEPRYGYVYGVALDGTGEKARAIEVLERTAEEHPYDRDVLYALLAFHRASGENARALVYATRLLEMNPVDQQLLQLTRELRSKGGGSDD